MQKKMKKFVTFIRSALFIDETTNTRIGLTQFNKEEVEDFSRNKDSIRNEDIKLSDLLRRS